MSEIERIEQRIRNREALIEYHEDAVAGLKLRNTADQQRLDALGESELTRTVRTVEFRIGDLVTAKAAYQHKTLAKVHLYYEGVEINEFIGPPDDQRCIVIRSGNLMVRIHETELLNVGLTRLGIK